MAPLETRYAPDRAFPPYKYQPGGAHPHPLKHPDGYAEPSDQSEQLLKDWRSQGDYLYGVDCFNHHYYWQAHESWEGLWRQCRYVDQGHFLKGLIQISAAGVHLHGENLNGFNALKNKAHKRLEPLLKQSQFWMGLDLMPLLHWSQGEEATDPPRLHLDFSLTGLISEKQ